ncbi:MAG TPA: hypothetical protein PKD27_03665 [Tepidiformaceae bacterium]|nr:hypothetical protein [Tepidiformaceae bacterium]
MAEERRNRQFWLETTLIFAAWTVSGLLQANQFYIQSQLRGRPVSWADALRPGLLESLLWALATLGIFWLARRFPLERGRMLPNVTVHLIAALIHGLVRAALMVELGQHVEWVGTRTFTPASSGEPPVRTFSFTRSCSALPTPWSIMRAFASASGLRSGWRPA